MAQDRFSFSAGQAPGFDFSPMQEGARAQAAAYQAFGQAVGQGIKDFADNKRKADAEDRMQNLIQNLSKDEWYKEEEITPAKEEFGELYRLFTDENGKVNDQLVSAHATKIIQERMGIDPLEAGSIVQKMMQPQKVRYLTDEGRVGLAKSVGALSGELAQLGLDPSYMVGPLQYAMNGAASTRDEALMGVRNTAAQMMQPQGMTEQEKLARMTKAQQDLALLNHEKERALAEYQQTASAASREKLMQLDYLLRGVENEANRMFQREMTASGQDFQRELTSGGQNFQLLLQEIEAGQRQGLAQQQAGYASDLSAQGFEQDRVLQKERLDGMLNASMQEAQQAQTLLGLKPTDSDMQQVRKLGAAVSSYLAPGGTRTTTFSMSADDMPGFQNNEVLMEHLRKAGYPGMGDQLDESELRNIRVGLSLTGDGGIKAIARVYEGGANPLPPDNPKTQAAQKVLDQVANVDLLVATRLMLGSTEVSQEQLEKMALHGPTYLGDGFLAAAYKLAEEGMPAMEKAAPAKDLLAPKRDRYNIGGGGVK